MRTPPFGAPTPGGWSVGGYDRQLRACAPAHARGVHDKARRYVIVEQPLTRPGQPLAGLPGGITGAKTSVRWRLDLDRCSERAGLKVEKTGYSITVGFWKKSLNSLYTQYSIMALSITVHFRLNSICFTYTRVQRFRRARALTCLRALPSLAGREGASVELGETLSSFPTQENRLGRV